MRFAFASTLAGLSWGGSEELWSRTAARLLERGHEVRVIDSRPAGDPPARLLELVEKGARRSRLWGAARADLVLVSMGYATDDLRLARVLRRLKIPYALLVQCVSADDWITEARLDDLRRIFLGARRVFVISRENREILERQLAMRLPRASTVDNPLAIAPASPLPWPAAGDGALHLACVGRLHCRSKGQDLILDVLARDRWRRRRIRVTFWGEDQGNREQLKALVRRRGLSDSARFAGFSARPEEIWREAHGLLLPSRYEGMPIVTVEAMYCGRVPIVTACGRNPEWVEEGVTGFLAPAATADLLDEALERAWRARDRWPEIGEGASRAIRARYDARPVETFAGLLEDLAGSPP